MGWGVFVVVIPPYFPLPYHHSDREFTGVSWWGAAREQQWEYWWARGYKMPHDSIQILLVVKPSQKDREFGNCGDNHCSKRRSTYTGCSWKVRPPVLYSFYKELNRKSVYLGVTNQEICCSFVAISEIRHWLRKKSDVTFYNILFRRKGTNLNEIIIVDLYCFKNNAYGIQIIRYIGQGFSPKRCIETNYTKFSSRWDFWKHESDFLCFNKEKEDSK